ncbi:MAG TPA: hypothetical protein VFZ89_00305 [Solirubrobacteraceae bacterium]
MRHPAVIAAAVLLAALASVAVVEPVPSYDPWSWLLWGREVAHGTLSTAEGPAFKPLPVAVCALLSPLGDLAPEAWVVLARAAGIGAVVLAFVVARHLASTGAGLLAAAAVALCGSYAGLAATGAIEPMVVCLALAGLLAWQRDMPRAALAAGVACALLRVEAWPFVALLGLVLWRRRPQDRALLVALAVAVPALWFVPEWLGSGDPLRSGTRARVPNPGQPALADVPLLASLGDALELVLLPLWLGGAALALRRRTPAATLAAAGAAWIVLVAVMAQAGFSGEARYAVPGAALLSIAGAVELTRSRALAALAVAAVAVAALPRLDDARDVRTGQAYQARLAEDLTHAITAAGGRRTLLACGRPYTGQYRGPLTAYALDVEKRRIGFDPRAPGVVLRSALRAGADPAPALLRRGDVVRHGLWTVQTTC